MRDWHVKILFGTHVSTRFLWVGNLYEVYKKCSISMTLIMRLLLVVIHFHVYIGLLLELCIFIFRGGPSIARLHFFWSHLKYSIILHVIFCQEKANIVGLSGKMCNLIPSFMQNSIVYSKKDKFSAQNEEL